MLYGVIDVGSNTIRLVIYQVEAGVVQAVLNQKYVAGLAGYITGAGNLSREGISVTVDILSDIQKVAQQIGLQEVFPFATASLRNINNREAVLTSINKKCGMQLRVLSGEEEGTYDYYGAIESMPIADGLLIDIGGGSTELVQYQKKKVVNSLSVPIGSLNLYNSFVAQILPTKAEIEKLRSEVEQQIFAILPAPVQSVETICAVGGSARSLFKLAKKRAQHKNDVSYSVDYLHDVLTLAVTSSKKLTADILKVSPERIHTLLPGTVILDTIAAIFGSKKIFTSPYGVREGYLYAVLEKKGLLNAENEN